MKNTTFLFVSLAALLVVAGCGGTGTQTAQNTGTANSASTPATATKPAASPTAPPPVPASDLKPDAIRLDKPVSAEELRNAVFGNEDVWMGKEVAIVGTYNGHSTSKLQSGDHYSVTVENDKGKQVIHCDGRTAPPADVKDKREGRIFKGTVKSVNRSWQRLTLEPCEIIK